jgi:hypothetical protein
LIERPKTTATFLQDRLAAKQNTYLFAHQIMVVPLFGWSAGDIVISIKILKEIGAAFRSVDGAKFQYAETSLWLESFASSLERVKDYLSANPDAKYTAQISQQVSTIDNAYALLEKYLQRYDKGLSSSQPANAVVAAVKKVKWALKELKGEVEKLKLAVTGPLLKINLLLHLQEL